jgi:hypothetical protein
MLIIAATQSELTYTLAIEPQGMGIREVCLPQRGHRGPERPQIRDPGPKRVRHGGAHVAERPRAVDPQD